MKNPERLAVVSALCAGLASCATPPRGSAIAPHRTSAEQAIAGWTPACAMLARTFMEKYGQPDVADPKRLLWLYNGPWARTTVEERSTPEEASCRLKQTFPRQLSFNDAAKAEDFDARITADPLRSELTVESDSEQQSFLILNLAYDVIHGRKTARQARAAYAHIQALTAAGKSSPYTSALMFTFDD